MLEGGGHQRRVRHAEQTMMVERLAGERKNVDVITAPSKCHGQRAEAKLDPVGSADPAQSLDRLAQRFDRLIQVAGVKLCATDVAVSEILADLIARAAIELDLPAKRRDRQLRRAAPKVTLTLRSCERRLLTQRCGSRDESFGLPQRLHGLGHPVSYGTD